MFYLHNLLHKDNPGDVNDVFFRFYKLYAVVRKTDDRKVDDKSISLIVFTYSSLLSSMQISGLKATLGCVLLSFKYAIHILHRHSLHGLCFHSETFVSLFFGGEEEAGVADESHLHVQTPPPAQ